MASVAVSIAVKPPPITTTGRRSCRLAIESVLAAPVSCSAIRKSDAMRTPGASAFGMAIIQKIMRQREARRSKPGNQHAPPTGRLDYRIAQVQRIPAREQAVDLESPGQPEDILEHPRLGLRNIDRLLLLIDAGLHAV